VRSAGGGVSQSFRQRLNQAFRGRIAGLAGGSGRRGRKNPRPRPPEDLHPEPTAWTGPERLQAVPGQRARFVMQCNAVDGFVPDRGEVTVEGDSEFTASVGDLRRGRLQIALEFADDAPLGESQLQIKLSFLRDAGGYAELGWPIKLELLNELPERRPSGAGTRRRRDQGELAFLWMSSNEENDWTADTVGELQELTGDQLAEADPETYGDLRGEDAEIPTVCLNGEFRDFAAYKRGVVRRVGDEAFKGRAERYALASGIAVANLYQREQELARKHRQWEEAKQSGSNGGEEPEKPMSEGQKQRALEQAARGVVALLPDFDALLGEDVEADERETVTAA
jgi:hypothetical protein